MRGEGAYGYEQLADSNLKLPAGAEMLWYIIGNISHMSDNTPQIRETGDGSHTLWLAGMQESYHSMHGAITESKHVFIHHGLDYFRSLNNTGEIRVLEVGFGTGLNALLTCQYSQDLKQRIKYTTLEPFPLDWNLAARMNYGDLLEHPQISFWFKELHITSWGQIEWLNPYFSILKKQETIQDHNSAEHYDICFFDAFAPGKQPDIWDLKVLEMVKRMLVGQGLIVSYCAQGQFKRDLRTLGFKVESLPGPPGKKEMTRAMLCS